LLDLFVRQPFLALEEEWLEDKHTLLRTGSPVEKYQLACQKLELYRCNHAQNLDHSKPAHAYLLLQGPLLGKAYQSIGLQYLSEKMGFPPPLIGDFERKLQICAYKQLLTFMDDCEAEKHHIIDPDQIKNDLLIRWESDLQTLQTELDEEKSIAESIVDELEVYYNTRYYVNR
jgi:hypothetical protein